MYFHPLNFIRFILALGVLLFHYGTVYYPFDQAPLKTIIDNSSFRVSFFFFISGFVMSLVYGRGDVPLRARYFYRKRLTRIFPVYWLAFVLTLMVVVMVKGASPKGLVIVLHALGLQSWNPGYVLDLNFTTWSISVELFFYALFPFVMNWIRRLKTRELILFAVAVWLVQSAQHWYFVNHLSDGSKKTEEFISDFPLWHLGTFIAGMVTGRVVILDLLPGWFQHNALWFFLLALCFFAWIVLVPNPVLRYIHNGLLAPFYALLILALYHDRSLLAKFLGSAPLSSLGNLSYGIFIFQYPLWVLANATTSDGFRQTTSFFLIYLLSVLVVSGLVYRFFEKPVLKALRTRMQIISEK